MSLATENSRRFGEWCRTAQVGDVCVMIAPQIVPIGTVSSCTRKMMIKVKLISVPKADKLVVVRVE